MRGLHAVTIVTMKAFHRVGTAISCAESPGCRRVGPSPLGRPVRSKARWIQSGDGHTQDKGITFNFLESGFRTKQEEVDKG